MTTKPPKQLEWRLAIVMAERGIRTATELHRRLTEYGVEISSDRVSRIVSQRPDRLNLDLLAGLASVLDCDTNELLRLLPPGPGDATASGSTSAPTKKPRSSRTVKAPATKPVTKAPAAPKSDFDALVSGVLNTKVHAIPAKKRD